MAILLLTVIVSTVGFAIRERRKSREWSEACYAQGLVMDAEYVCIIPGVDQEYLNWYLGRPIIRVVLRREDEAIAFFGLPPCPLPMQIFALKSLSPETRERLRSRFGNAVQ